MSKFIIGHHWDRNSGSNTLVINKPEGPNVEILVWSAVVTDYGTAHAKAAFTDYNGDDNAKEIEKAIEAEVNAMLPNAVYLGMLTLAHAIEDIYQSV